MTAHEHPIPFSGPMVRAILDGRKTQTRRLVRLQPSLDPLSHDYATGATVAVAERTEANPVAGFGVSFLGDRGLSRHQLCPHGAPGDRLWVREAWRVSADQDHIAPRDLPRDLPRDHGMPWYCATGNGHGDEQPSGCAGGLGRKRPPMFMMRWMSRLTLEVVDVRVERLQGISEADALAEGVTPLESCGASQQLTSADGRTHGSHPHTLAFAVGWDTLHGEPARWWIRNPWVWALTFSVHVDNR